MNEIGNNLKKARIIKGMSLSEAGKVLNMSATAVSKYEKGQIAPNSTKLIDFAKAYDVNVLDLLEVYEDPKMQFASFRKRKRLQGKKLEILKETIQREVSKYLEVLNLSEEGHKEFNLIYKNCKNFEDAEDAANEFRKEIGISSRQPISDLISVLENLGILIISIKNVNNMFDEFDGEAEIVKGVPCIVILDDITDGARQRFTIAHELGHLLLKMDTEDEKMQEKLANRFAGSLLMPEEAIKAEFGSKRNGISFFELKAFKFEYKVSYSSIVYRLKDLNIINRYYYENLMKYIAKKIGKNDPEPIEKEESYQFKRLVYKLEARGIISLSRACELLEVTTDEYNQEEYSNRY